MRDQGGKMFKRVEQVNPQADTCDKTLEYVKFVIFELYGLRGLPVLPFIFCTLGAVRGWAPGR